MKNKTKKITIAKYGLFHKFILPKILMPQI